MTLKSRIAVFKDSGFQAMREYGADDVSPLLAARKALFRLVGHDALRNISRQDTDILVMPYVRGDFTPRELDALIRFHAAGGSLLFLGDLPHKDKWYPLRNMHAPLFHLTRCYDECLLDMEASPSPGLTGKGAEILGRLEDPEFFRGKALPCLRVTAFPPDMTYSLLKITSYSHAENSSAVIAVERRCKEFLGARFAQIGFIGGEPRENVDGAYQLEWTYNPGLLTRKWKGIDAMVLSLLRWLEPSAVAGSIDLPPLGVHSVKGPMGAEVRNTGVIPVRIPAARLRIGGKTLKEWKPAALEPGETRHFAAGARSHPFGAADCTLELRGGDGWRPLVSTTLRTLSSPASTDVGYGFSTYWAFQTPKVTEQFKFFCRRMIERGCQYARVNIPWEDVELRPGRYDWRVPDQLLEFAADEGFLLQFWMFPTTRGSGLADGGVPWWSLKEPAIDRHGNKGYFPSLWSPFYRKYYFGMLERFATRYADAAPLMSFIFDFGNSDFPYGYYYYGGDNTIFDYSPHERAAFATYLQKELEWPLEKVSKLYGRKFRSFDEVPVPFSEEREPFRVYMEFRSWSVSQGVRQANEVARACAPSKLPSDPPGHGLGSIADTSTYFIEAKAKHWLDEKKFDPRLTYAHNAPLHSLRWGGEAWQVGGEYRQYDDALFQSVRLNASYMTIPGADLGLYGDDIARIGFIRRELMGSTRPAPELAVFDRHVWKGRTLVNIATRLDLPVDLIFAKHRYDFSCYKLMTLPDNDFLDCQTGGNMGGGQLVPADEQWYWLLRESVEKGLTLLVFPKSCELVGAGRLQRTFLRQVFGLEDVRYGPRARRTIEFPGSFGGGVMRGNAHDVRCDGEVLLRDAKGAPFLVRVPFGKGAVLLAGYDITFDDSFDSACDFEEDACLKEHTLVKICSHLGIRSNLYDTGNLFMWKELLRKNGSESFIVFSHLRRPVKGKIRVRLAKPSNAALDLATGEQFPLIRRGDGWSELALEFRPWSGRYLRFE